MDVAIENAADSPKAAELMRVSRRFEELRASPAWAELREEVKQRRDVVIRVLGEKAIRGTPSGKLRDEGIYVRGFLDGCELLLDRPGEVEKKLERLIHESYEKLRNQMMEATLNESPYG